MTGHGAVAERVADALGEEIRSIGPLGGGDIGDSYRVETADGRWFAKTLPDPPPGMFELEAAGLRWLAEPGVIGVPRVRHVDAHLLVLEWVEPGRPTADTRRRLGRDLARLHDAGADGFGRVFDVPGIGLDVPDRLGSVPIDPTPCATWTELFADRRLRPMTSSAVERGRLDGSALDLVERVVGRLDDLVGDPEPPSRVHGDLWSGNVQWAADGSARLIDPHAHGGHRETDLAMLALFGGLDAAIVEGYEAEHPLPSGWRDRQPLHQLTPLLAHTILFGGGYAGQTLAVLRRYA